METNAWTHPTTGQIRHYLEWTNELMEIDRYNTGNIRGASYRGESISNAQASRLAACKAWLDDEGELHIKYVDNNVVTRAEFEAAIREHLTPVAEANAEETEDAEAEAQVEASGGDDDVNEWDSERVAREFPWIDKAHALRDKVNTVVEFSQRSEATVCTLADMGGWDGYAPVTTYDLERLVLQAFGIDLEQYDAERARFAKLLSDNSPL